MTAVARDHRAIGKNFNNDLNVQVNEMFNSNIPKINVGDVIGKISHTGCLSKGPCSEAGRGRLPASHLDLQLHARQVIKNH